MITSYPQTVHLFVALLGLIFMHIGFFPLLGVGDLDDFGSVSGKVTYKDVDKLGRNLDKVKIAAR